jgi:chromate transporter
MVLLKMAGILFVINALTIGGGYAMIPMLQREFVNNYHWLSNKEFIDAIAIGQVTPGPLFTTATFIGYLLGGVPGAVLATLGIFLPSFVFVAVGGLFLRSLRGSPWAGGFLDGVNVAALGLMLGVTVQLARTALVDPLTLLLALAALALLLRFKLNSTWIILGGALIGLLHSFL